MLMDHADINLVALCIKDTFGSIVNPLRKKRYLEHLQQFNKQYGLRVEVNNIV